MTDEAKKLVEALREDAEWAHANEWETPITLGDHLVEAADLIEKLIAQLVNQATEYGRALKITTEQRDAAVADLKDALDRGDAASFCEFCKHNDDWGKCEHPCNPYSGETGWEWRGVKENAE